MTSRRGSFFPRAARSRRGSRRRSPRSRRRTGTRGTRRTRTRRRTPPPLPLSPPLSLCLRGLEELWRLLSLMRMRRMWGGFEVCWGWVGWFFSFRYEREEGGYVFVLISLLLLELGIWKYGIGRAHIVARDDDSEARRGRGGGRNMYPVFVHMGLFGWLA